MKPVSLLLSVCVFALACSGRNANRTQPAIADRSVIVIKGSEFSGSVLDGLRSRIPSMVVMTGGTTCPVIIFRGPRSVRNPSYPSVYVDRTLMADTCILQQISSTEVDRVLVYPSGQVTEPSIQRNPFGVIAIYRVQK